MKKVMMFWPLLGHFQVQVKIYETFFCTNQIKFLQETVNTGFFHMRSTCRRCGGQGHIITTPCKKCRGKGSMYETKTVSIPIPAGISVYCLYCIFNNNNITSHHWIIIQMVMRIKKVVNREREMYIDIYNAILHVKLL